MTRRDAMPVSVLTCQTPLCPPTLHSALIHATPTHMYTHDTCLGGSRAGGQATEGGPHGGYEDMKTLFCTTTGVDGMRTTLTLFPVHTTGCETVFCEYSRM